MIRRACRRITYSNLAWPIIYIYIIYNIYINISDSARLPADDFLELGLADYIYIIYIIIYMCV